MDNQLSYRICPLCEATCGLAIEHDGKTVARIRGDEDDAFSRGYLCPKGVALKDLHEDPDRLRCPQVRDGNTWRDATWEEAFGRIDAALTRIRAQHGPDAVGMYIGNPTVHNVGLLMYTQALARALGTANIFTATTVDQMPKQFVCGLLFGTGLSIPIPDLDRCNYLLMLGANPLESNGSLLTAPDIANRLRDIQRRGGRIVVIDPRRTKTAEMADAHYAIRPGADAYLLFAMVHTILEEDLADPGRLIQWVDGIDEIRARAAAFPPERVAERCGIPAETIRALARELAAADRAAVYGRMGTCTQEFGTLASWLPEVLHVLTGNLDREGGAMFTNPAHGAGNAKGRPGVGKGLSIGRRKSRVSGRPEIFGELPVACLAEEIETEGDGQIRALFTVAGNPAVSTPNGGRLANALDTLEFMVSLDVYRNETTSHADVILPGPSALCCSHYDLAFSQLAIRNTARYSPPVFEKPAGMPHEWETVLRLVAIVSGMGVPDDTAALDDMVLTTLIAREQKPAESVIHDRDPDEIVAALAPRRGPERLLDFMLRTGPYGDGLGANPDGLTLDVLLANPHGIDLGPLQPRLPEVLRTPTGRIDLAQPLITDDIARLEERLDSAPDGLTLIGRRHVRSCNSWMHNVPMLVTGSKRCTLQMNPADAADRGIQDGQTVEIRSRVGAVRVSVEVTDAMATGVVSLPHGWGHDAPEAQLQVAAGVAGVNSNVLTDETCLDEPSGNAVLNGIPVTVEAVAPSESVAAVK